MEILHPRILALKQVTSGITGNPVLDAFDLAECKKLDSLAASDSFIKDKIKACLRYLSSVGVQYDPRYNSAYEEYTEALTYVTLKEKFDAVTKVPEGSSPTPDFKVEHNEPKPTFEIYLEVKALSFSDGALNYNSAQQSQLGALISVESQLNDGRQVAQSEAVIMPYLNRGKSPSRKDLIEILISKIENNIKEAQYQQGETLLLVDLKQLPQPCSWDENAIALYVDKSLPCIASGILWNVAFGNAGECIFAPIEFEGKENISGHLTSNGILHGHDYIKGLVFAEYDNMQCHKYVGFYRSRDDQTQPIAFLSSYCDFCNDENNSLAFKILR